MSQGIPSHMGYFVFMPGGAEQLYISIKDAQAVGDVYKRQLLYLPASLLMHDKVSRSTLTS